MKIIKTAKYKKLAEWAASYNPPPGPNASKEEWDAYFNQSISQQPQQIERAEQPASKEEFIEPHDPHGLDKPKDAWWRDEGGTTTDREIAIHDFLQGIESDLYVLAEGKPTNNKAVSVVSADLIDKNKLSVKISVFLVTKVFNYFPKDVILQRISEMFNKRKEEVEVMLLYNFKYPEEYQIPGNTSFKISNIVVNSMEPRTDLGEDYPSYVIGFTCNIESARNLAR
tara:strand:- start:13368 stop:14045 length:678 start_codon:yes stop_codon:yes gene_type:complete